MKWFLLAVVVFLGWVAIVSAWLLLIVWVGLTLHTTARLQLLAVPFIGLLLIRIGKAFYRQYLRFLASIPFRYIPPKDEGHPFI